VNKHSVIGSLFDSKSSLIADPKKPRLSFVIFLILFTSFLVQSVLADDYQVNITRKGNNIYKVTIKEIYIFTRFCHEYVYYSDAILKMHGYIGEILFLENNEKCDVKAVYGLCDLDAGTYKVTVTYLDQDWYEVDATNIAVKVPLCMHLSIGEMAILRVEASKIARLIFNDDEEYFVEGIFSKLRL